MQYVIDKTKRTHMLNFFQDFDRRVVVELDSALNIWIDNIPEHCSSLSLVTEFTSTFSLCF